MLQTILVTLFYIHRLSIGFADVLDAKFDCTSFRANVNEILRLLRDDKKVKEIIIALQPPILERDNDIEYWMRLEEANQELYFASQDNEQCSHWNLFSTFTSQKKDNGMSLYDVRNHMYRKLNVDGTANLSDFHNDAYEKLKVVFAMYLDK